MSQLPEIYLTVEAMITLTNGRMYTEMIAGQGRPTVTLSHQHATGQIHQAQLNLTHYWTAWPVPPFIHSQMYHFMQIS